MPKGPSIHLSRGLFLLRGAHTIQDLMETLEITYIHIYDILRPISVFMKNIVECFDTNNSFIVTMINEE